MEDSLAPGLVLQNRFRVERSICVGGWGEVYRGVDLHSGRPVAIKRAIPTDPNGESERDPVYALRRFQEEVRVLQELDFPGIPKCLDSFTMTDGRYCLVMEFIEGVDLQRQLLDQIKLAGEMIPAATAVEYLIQACIIVEHLHALRPHPVIHRDIKPSNLILRHSDQRIYLVDFGFARPVGPSMGTKTLVGTIGYAPIEQCQGNPGPLSDLYALGATLSYLLTGKQPTPFDIQPLEQDRPDLPESLARAVAVATHNDRSHRYASVNVFRQALEDSLPELRQLEDAPSPPNEVSPSPETEELPAICESSVSPPLDDARAYSLAPPSFSPGRKSNLMAVPRSINWSYGETKEPHSDHRGSPPYQRGEPPVPSDAAAPPPAAAPPQVKPKPISKSSKPPAAARSRLIALITVLVGLIISAGILSLASERHRQLRFASDVLPGWQATAARGLEQGPPQSIILSAQSTDQHFASSEVSGFLAVRSKDCPPPRSIELSLEALEPATLWLCVGMQGEETCHVYRLVLLARSPDPHHPLSPNRNRAGGEDRPWELTCNIYQEGQAMVSTSALLPPTASGGFLLPSEGDDSHIIRSRGSQIELRANSLDRLGISLQASPRPIKIRVKLAI